MPPAIVTARWFADEGDAELVLYDSGELKIRIGGVEYRASSPWDSDTEPPPDGEGDE